MTNNFKYDESIPVFDVKEMSTDSDNLKRMAQEVHHAFTTIGFLAVVNHGIPAELVSDITACCMRDNECWACVSSFFSACNPPFYV